MMRLISGAASGARNPDALRWNDAPVDVSLGPSAVMGSGLSLR